MKLVFLGPPGSGKGTQAKKLAEKMGIPHISLGDILRDEVHQETEIGKKIKEIMNAGRLVPDEITIALTRRRIEQVDCEAGFILDGFPRSWAQATALDEMVRELKIDLSAVVYFSITEDLVVERLSGRRSCKNCGAVYHIKFNPPKVAGKCDRCGENLFQRADDEEKAIRTRFEVYEMQTKPLIEHYRKMGKLVELDAGKPITEVYEKLIKLVENG